MTLKYECVDNVLDTVCSLSQSVSGVLYLIFAYLACCEHNYSQNGILKKKTVVKRLPA